jgi:sugar lactone lactonase YvrE
VRRLATGTRLGEGPRWAEGRLLWVDIEGCAVHVFSEEVDRVVRVDAMVGAVVPWHGDLVLVALADAIASLDLASGEVSRLLPLPGARPGLRANDCNVDPAGRLWIGTMALDEAPGAATLSRWDGDREPVTILRDLTISNGLGWVGERMYFADTPTGRVDVLDYDPGTGEVSGRRPFAEVEAPDGLCTDDEGAVWVASHGAGEVRRFTPDGALDAVLEVPDVRCAVELDFRAVKVSRLLRICAVHRSRLGDGLRGP